jgi:hypothetical protein
MTRAPRRTAFLLVLVVAGCGDERILRHCRDEGEHVPGCWVVDLALGRSS